MTIPSNINFSASLDPVLQNKLNKSQIIVYLQEISLSLLNKID